MRILIAGLLLGLPATTVASLTCLPSAADAAPAPARRAATSLSLVGNGYGHGHGLSQYGAQGQASKGRGYRDILGFYYRHLHQGRASGKVKVLISADTTNDVVVRARSGLTVRSVGAKRATRLDAKTVSWWKVKPADHGATSLLYGKREGTWRKAGTLQGQAEFTAGGRPITLRTPAGDVAYRGVLRSAAPNPKKGARDTVNILSLEAYLKGVVPREMPPSWKPAALKAQAVAARTYAAYERRQPLARHYQICDTSLCQVYGGYSAEYGATNRAIGDTAHQILTTKDHKPAFTQFSASDGGWTAAGGVSYLAARKDPYDQAYRHWTATVSAGALQAAFPGMGDFTSARVLARDGNGEWGGRVTRIRLTFSGGSTTITGDQFRSYFGLRSSWFKLR